MTMTNDLTIGATVQRLREHLGLTQTRLAEEMVTRGHPWHQQTVAKTEKGARPLRVTEACDLATVLHVDLGQLSGVSATSPELLAVRGHLERCEEAERAAQVARATENATRASLRASARGVPDLPPDLRSRVDALLAGAED